MKRIIFCLLLLMGAFGFATAQNASFSSMENKDFAKVIYKKKTQVVDVRSASEYAGGHIERAVNIDVNCKDFDRQIERLDKKRPVAVYCHTGKRSKIAAGKLSDKGFKVFELDKGIKNWDGKVCK